MDELVQKQGPEYQELATRIRAARIGAGMTQAEAAARLGRPQSFISKCESVERRVDVIELLTLGRLYGVTLGFFVCGLLDG